MQLHQQSELQRLQNDVLKRQVDELKSLLSDVKDSMSKFPVPAKEPERMLVLNNGGFMQLDSNDMAYEILQRCCMDATNKYGVPSCFNFIGGQKQYIAAGYMPASSMPAGSTHADQKIALDLCGIDTPRKASFCQHTVMKDAPLVFEGLHNHPAPAEMTDLGAAAAVDPTLGAFLEKMAASDTPYPSSDNGDDFKLKVLMEFFKGVQSSPERAFYAGVPVRVHGQAVGSFCILGPKKPQEWDDKGDVLWLEQQALKAAHSLEKQVEMKRFQHAQQAMMTQMMQMQQQMMAGMMPGGGVGSSSMPSPTPWSMPRQMPSGFTPLT